MYVVNKPKDTGKHYNKLYYKTLGENPDYSRVQLKKTRSQVRNLIHRQAYSQYLFIFTVFKTQKETNNYNIGLSRNTLT